MKLSDWARANGVHPKTAYRWWRNGTLPVPPRQINARVILVDDAASANRAAPELPAVGLYARVSSHDQRSDLDRQVARLSEWAAKDGARVLRIEAEVGSGTNGARAKVRRLLADPAVRTVVVEHRDRLGRMNVELVEAALSAGGRSLVVLDLAERDDDLVRDMTEVLTSFCARLYGRRSARNRAETALRFFESPNVNTNASAPDRKARFRTDDRRWDPVAGATGTSAARRGGWTPRASPSLPTA